MNETPKKSEKLSITLAGPDLEAAKYVQKVYGLGRIGAAIRPAFQIAAGVLKEQENARTQIQTPTNQAPSQTSNTEPEDSNPEPEPLSPEEQKLLDSISKPATRIQKPRKLIQNLNPENEEMIKKVYVLDNGYQNRRRWKEKDRTMSDHWMNQLEQNLHLNSGAIEIIERDLARMREEKDFAKKYMVPNPRFPEADRIVFGIKPPTVVVPLETKKEGKQNA